MCRTPLHVIRFVVDSPCSMLYSMLCNNKSPQQVVEQVGQLVAQRVNNKSTASCMQQPASLTASRTTCCTTNPELIEVMESDTMPAGRCGLFHPKFGNVFLGL